MFTGENEQNLYDVWVTVSLDNSKLNDSKLYLNCFILGQVREKDLPGRGLNGQFEFEKTTLADICGMVEKGLEKVEINYHSSIPIKPGPGHTHVSYELLRRSSDTNWFILARDLEKMLTQLVTAYRQGRS